MWHEARRQEKQIRNAMVDVKKRAERRKDFYERIKEDPIRFLRLYGSKSKLNIDPEVAAAAENPNTLMTWVGDNSTVIDRFDIRANLARIDEKKPYTPTPDEKLEERMCNYERYRCLVHNQFAKVAESSALGKIEITEKYGEDLHKVEKQNNSKKKNTSEKAAIGYVYADTDYTHNPKNSDDSDESLDSEPDLEMDLDIELDIGELAFTQQKELTRISQIYGMHGNDYLKLMKVDKTQEEEFRTAKLLEEQKAQFHGRKSRRERKIFKEQRLKEKYMRQDPKTLTFGASVFHEELYVGKDILTPSPEHQAEYSSSTYDNKKSLRPANTPSQKSTFINVPTIHDDDDDSSDYRKHSSRKRRSTSKSSCVNDSRHSRNRENSSRDNKRHKISSSKRSKNSPHRRSSIPRKNNTSTIRNNNRSYCRNKDSRSSVESDVKVHGYDFSGQRSPNAEKETDKKTEEEMLKKKYYRSESEKDNSDSSDYSTNASSTERSSSSCDNKDQLHKQISSSQNKSTGNYGGNASSKGKPSINKVDIIASKCNPQEFLKRQMEKQLNRAFCEDKKAEQEKLKKVEKERLDRENQLREMAVQIRRREREKFTNPSEDASLDATTTIDSSLPRRSPQYLSRSSRFGPRRSSHSRSKSRSKNHRCNSRHRYNRSRSRNRSRNRHTRRKRNHSKSSTASHSSSTSSSSKRHSVSRYKSNTDRHSNRSSHTASVGHQLLLPSSSNARYEHYKSTKYQGSGGSHSRR